MPQRIIFTGKLYKRGWKGVEGEGYLGSLKDSRFMIVRLRLEKIETASESALEKLVKKKNVLKRVVKGALFGGHRRVGDGRNSPVFARELCESVMRGLLGGSSIRPSGVRVGSWWGPTTQR